MDAQTGNDVLSAILDLVFGSAAGDRVQVFDALTLQRIADMTIPGGQASNAKARTMALKKEIAELRAFFSRTASVRSGKDRQIRTPQFLELAGSTLKTKSGDTTLILFGSAYYLDEKDPESTFGHGRYPSDGCVLASSQQSVFGTSNKQALLNGAVVHFCYLSEHFDCDQERTAIRRFWKIHCDGLGANLSTFVASTGLTVERALSGVTDPVTRDRVDPRDTTIEMRSVRATRVERVEVGDETAGGEQEEPIPRLPTGADPRIQVALDEIPRPAHGALTIAAVWVAEGNAVAADVDLYVAPTPSAAELCFSKRQTPEGTYLRDIRSARSDLGDDRWIACWEVVEIVTARADDATCWLNLYRGPGGAISGVVRILFADRAVDRPFAFPAIAGDGAAGRHDRKNRPCWIEIDLKQPFAAASTAAQSIER
jgi:hypothetical protein